MPKFSSDKCGKSSRESGSRRKARKVHEYITGCVECDRHRFRKTRWQEGRHEKYSKTKSLRVRGKRALSYFSLPPCAGKYPQCFSHVDTRETAAPTTRHRFKRRARCARRVPSEQTLTPPAQRVMNPPLIANIQAPCFCGSDCTVGSVWTPGRRAELGRPHVDGPLTLEVAQSPRWTWNSLVFDLEFQGHLSAPNTP